MWRTLEDANWDGPTRVARFGGAFRGASVPLLGGGRSSLDEPTRVARFGGAFRGASVPLLGGGRSSLDEPTRVARFGGAFRGASVPLLGGGSSLSWLDETTRAALIARVRAIEHTPYGMWRRVKERRQHDPAVRPTLEEARRIVYLLLRGERHDPHPRGADLAAQWLQHRHATTLDTYVTQSVSDADVWNALDEIVFRLVLEATPLNDRLRDWFMGVRAGERPCPARRPGPDPSVRAERNERIAEAVDMLVAVGMPRSRRHGKKSDGHASACEVVSMALADHHDVHIGYSTVESAWRTYHRTRRTDV